MSFLVTAAATATTSAIVGGATATTVGAALAGGSIGAGLAGAAAGAATAGALGAGVGAISSAAQGQDVGKGALMGAASGVVTAGVAGGVGAAIGPAAVGGTEAALQGVAQGVGNVAAGAAGGATGAAVGGNDVGKGALVGAGTAAAAQVASGLVGGIGSSVGAPPDTTVNLGPGTPAGPAVPAGPGVTTNALPTLGKIDPGVPMEGNLAANAPGAPPTPAAPATSMLDPTAKFLSQSGTPITAQGIKGTLGGLGGAVAGDYAGNGIIDAQDAAAKAAGEDKARGLDFASQGSSGLAGVRAAGLPDGTGPLGGLGSIGRATGGITALAHGGQVALGDGAYIIPADVVSALGNGSSKAGADYLRRLMIEVRKEAVNLQGMGAAKKHVS